MGCRKPSARCIVVACEFDYHNRITLYVTQVPLSIAACMSLVAPPQISLQWFPKTERRSATGFAFLSLYLGITYSFVIDCILIYCFQGTENLMRKFRYFQMTQALVAAFVFYLILALYPKKQSAYIPSFITLSQRFSLKASVTNLRNKRRIWVCLVCSGIIIGSYIFFFYQISWVVDQLDLFEEPDQNEKINTTDLLLFALAVSAAMIVSVSVAYLLFRLSDRCERLFFFILSILVIYTFLFTLLLLYSYLLLEVLDRLALLIFFLCLGLGASTCVIVFTPLFAEFICDFMYPVPEDFTYAIFFSSVFVIPTIFSIGFFRADGRDDTEFAKWAISIVTGCAILGTSVFAFLKNTKNTRYGWEIGAQKRAELTNDASNLVSISYQQIRST